MYRRYKREQEQLQKNRTALEKAKVKSEKPKKLPTSEELPKSETTQKQDVSTNVSQDLKKASSQKIQFQEKTMFASSNKESNTLLKKKRRKSNKKLKKKKKHRFFDCFKVCVRKKTSSDQSAEEAKSLGDQKSVTSLKPLRIKSSENSKRTTPRSNVLTPSKSGIKTETSNDGLVKDKLNLEISSELYGVKKFDEAETSNSVGQENQALKNQLRDQKSTKEDKEVLVKTEKYSDIKKKKDLQKKATVTAIKTEIPEVQIKQEVSGDSKKTGKSSKESSVEKKSPGFLSKSKKDEKVEKWKDHTEICCPLCLQNADTVTSLYAREMNKDTNSLHVSINNYYTDKWQKQIQQTMVRPKTRTVQTSVRPRSRNAATSTDERLLNKTCDNVRYLECTDEKITVCRSRRN